VVGSAIPGTGDALADGEGDQPAADDNDGDEEERGSGVRGGTEEGGQAYEKDQEAHVRPFGTGLRDELSEHL
jgi:hypothetical protein